LTTDLDSRFETHMHFGFFPLTASGHTISLV
jgi:hypothetical protein